MKLMRYSLICLVVALTFLTTGCAQNRISINNPNNDMLEYARNYNKQVEKNYPQMKQVAQPTAKSTGNVIDLGSSYESIDINSPFGRI